MLPPEISSNESINPALHVLTQQARFRTPTGLSEHGDLFQSDLPTQTESRTLQEAVSKQDRLEAVRNALLKSNATLEDSAFVNHIERLQNILLNRYKSPDSLADSIRQDVAFYLFIDLFNKNLLPAGFVIEDSNVFLAQVLHDFTDADYQSLANSLPKR